jgi:hypothetical protein
MRSAIAAGLIAASMLAAASETIAQDFVGRSRQCVDLLKRKNPGTHIRSGLTDRSCPLEPLATRYTSAPDRPWLASGRDCDGALDQETACGLDSNLLGTLDRSLVRIKIGGGRCIHVSPIMLTDKPDGFKCNAVKARTACVLGTREENGRTIVKLGSGRAVMHRLPRSPSPTPLNSAPRSWSNPGRVRCSC